MTIILTAVGRVRDWKALTAIRQSANRTGRLRIYRDVKDASRALIVAELSDDDISDLDADLRERVELLDDAGFTDSGVWEAIDAE